MPRCGSVVRPSTDLRAEHLRSIAAYVNCCGHGQEVIPFPLPDGSVQLVPVVGEAT